VPRTAGAQGVFPKTARCPTRLSLGPALVCRNKETQNDKGLPFHREQGLPNTAFPSGRTDDSDVSHGTGSHGRWTRRRPSRKGSARKIKAWMSIPSGGQPYEGFAWTGRPEKRRGLRLKRGRPVCGFIWVGPGRGFPPGKTTTPTVKLTRRPEEHGLRFLDADLD